MYLGAIAGPFGCVGLRRAENVAVLYGNRWETPPLLDYNNTENRGIGTANQFLYWRGTWFVVGNITAETVGGGSNSGYGWAWWSHATSQWIGGLFSAGAYGATGYCMQLYDDGNGERLYIGQDTDVKKIDFDYATQTLTSVTSISFAATVSNFSPRRMCVWDADEGTGPQLVVVGNSTNASYKHVVLFDGTNFTAIGGPASTSNSLRGVGVHDFGDGIKRLIVCGGFTTIGATAGYGNIGAYETIGGWSKLGSGITAGTGMYLSSVASFQGKLWAGRGYDSRPSSVSGVTLSAWTGSVAGGAWATADSVCSNLGSSGFIVNDDNGAGGTSSKGAAVHDLQIYAGKLHVIGEYSFRALPNGQYTAGGLAYYKNRTDNKVYRAMPIVDGSVLATCEFDGGLAVAGEYTRTMPDGTVITNIGKWTDPDDAEAKGVWESLGNANGIVYGLAVFGGELHAVGAFTLIGGVTCSGFARYDGSAWHSVLDITEGTARCIVNFDGYLVVAGDFGRAAGAPSRKIIFAWDGSNHHAVVTDIDGVGADPDIRALYVNTDGTYLYAGGDISTVDDGAGNETVNGIMRTQSGSSWGWEKLGDDDGPATPGIQTATGSVWAIGEFDGYILVGCETSAIGGAQVTPNALWKWNTGTPAWDIQETALEANATIAAIGVNSDASLCWVSVSGKLNSETVNRVRVREYKSGSANVWIGPSPGTQFAAQPGSLVYCDGGAGNRLYIGGEPSAVSGPSTSRKRIAQCLCAIDAELKLHDVAGGVGVTAYNVYVGRQFAVRGTVNVMSETRAEVQAVKITGTLTGGTLTLTIVGADGEDHDIDIAWDATFATVVSAAQTAIDAEFGLRRFTAGGTDWDGTGLTLTFDGFEFIDIMRPLAVADVSALTGTDIVAAVTRTTEVPEPRLMISGAFAHTNDESSQFMCGLDLAHNIRRIRGQLSGSYGGDALGGPLGIAVIPRSEWPAEWEDPSICDMGGLAEPYLDHAFLIIGSFAYFENDYIRRQDIGIIRDTYPCEGIVAHYGNHFRDLGIKMPPPGEQTVECFENQIVCASSPNPPQYYDYDDETWYYLKDPGDSGAITAGVDLLIRWKSKLWCLGGININGTSGAFVVVEWSGGAYTTKTVSQFSSANAYVRAHHACIGEDDVMYLAGNPNTGDCPVVKSSDGSSWSAVGGNTQLQGEAWAIARVNYLAQPYLVIQGLLLVNEGSGWVDCEYAYFDGTDWHVGGFTLGDTQIPAAMGDYAGLADCEQLWCRALLGGSATEIAQGSTGEYGTEDAFEANSIAQFKRAVDGGVTGAALGTNSTVRAMASAARFLFPIGSGIS